MPIHLLFDKPTDEQVREMLEPLVDHIKVAVDIRRQCLAGGGAMHADCEEVLLESGSGQHDIWVADWLPETREVEFESFINIRPRQGNRGMEIQDPGIRRVVEAVVRKVFE